MSKNPGHDVTLGWDEAGGSSYTTVGQIIDIGGPSLERNAIDVTTRDSTENWREFIKGFKDGGEVTFNVVLDLSLATHGTASTGILGDFYDDGSTLPTFKLTFPNSRAFTFSGLLTGWSSTEPLDDALTADVTVKISGKPTEGAA